MSLFGGQLKAQILGYETLFRSIGFDYAKSAEDPTSLKTFLDTKVGTARTEAKAAAGGEILVALNLAAPEGKSAADTIKAELAAKDTTLAIYTAGLEAAGVRPAAQKDKALTSDDVKSAVENRSSKKAAAIVAAAGHEPVKLAGSPEGGSSAADLRDEYDALIASGDSLKAGAFFNRNAAAMFPPGSS